MDNGNVEFRGFKKDGDHYDVINGDQRKKMIFFDLTLRLESILNGYCIDLKTKRDFKEPTIWESFAAI